MSDSAPKKGGKCMTTSPARKARYQHYASSHLREQHKVKRVLQSSGYDAAQKYAAEHMVLGFLARLSKGES
jgi:hypothetical protein